jgi:hypothetical protein
MKNLIITASDKKYGDFLINHWLKSLEENTNLSNIEIAILDYGLDKEQKKELKKHKITIIKSKRNGHVTIIRFRDIYHYLKNKKYHNVLMCDSGDIIFQTDIARILSSPLKKMTASYDTTNLLFQQ